MRGRNHDAQGGGGAVVDKQSGRIHCHCRGGGEEPAGPTSLPTAGREAQPRVATTAPAHGDPALGSAPERAEGAVGVPHGPKPRGSATAASDAPAAGDSCPSLPRLPLLRRRGQRRHLGATAAAASGKSSRNPGAELRKRPRPPRYPNFELGSGPRELQFPESRTATASAP